MLYWGQSVQNLQCFQPFPTPIICRPLPGRRTFDRSIFNPSISQRYRCGVNRRTSFSFCGRWYAPAPAAYSLYSRMHPSRSLQNSLMQSRRLPQNRNSVLVNGSGLNRCCTMAATPIDSFPQIRIAAGEIYTLSALVKLRSMISVPGKSSTLQPCPHLNRCLLSLFRSGCLQPLHPLSPAQAAMGVLLRLIRPYL